LGLVTTVFFGCGSGPQLAEVEGRVTKSGQPQENLWVKFSPAGGRPSHARTDADGRFAIRYKDRVGALIGTHQVAIGSGGERDERGNPLNKSIELLNTDVKVEPGNNSFDFELDDFAVDRG
jgi:hypothetical protein